MRMREGPEPAELQLFFDTRGCLPVQCLNAPKNGVPRWAISPWSTCAECGKEHSMVGQTWILRAGIGLLGSDLKAIKATMIDAQWKAPLLENVRHNAHTSHLCHYHDCCNPMHYCIEMAGLNYERGVGTCMEDCPHGNKNPTRICWHR